MGVDANIALSMLAKASKAVGPNALTAQVKINEGLQFKSGTAATDEADILFADTRTLTASATENLDLTGTLTDGFGDVVAAAEIVAIFVKAFSTNTNTVVIGNTATNAFVGPFGANTHTLALKAGEFVLLSSETGWTVTAGTGDLLKIANGGAGTSVKYQIVIIGRTVAA